MSILKVTLSEGDSQKLWVSSDFHFSHKNICRGVTDWRLPNGEIPIDNTRPFDTVDEMNDAIVNNVNNVVGQDDILIHLGDWSFSGFDSIQKFRERIICRQIHLILGNHDHWIQRNHENIQRLFSSVRDYMTLQIGKDSIELLHYPMSSWMNLNRGSIHLHGHCHLKNERKFGLGRRMDVGIDGHPEFRPYDIINEIIPMMKRREIKTEILDHHLVDFSSKTD